MKLLEHQQELVDRNPARHGIFFDTGTGKTLTAIRLAEKNSDNYLVITTKSLKLNWEREIQKFKQRECRIHIMSKEEFRRDYESVPHFDCVIFDEFHNWGNFKSTLHKNTAKYLKKHRPRYVYGLTATPVLSSVMSVWSLSRLLGQTLGSFMSFRSRYFYDVKMGPRTVPMQKKNIEQDIAQDLRSIGTVVAKEDVIDLPPSVHMFEYFNPTPQQKRAIKALDEDPECVLQVVYNTKMIQILNGCCNGKVYKSEKLERVKELVDEWPKFVVVAKHTAELEMLHEALPGSYLYNGQTKQDDRDFIVEEFNNSKKGVFIMQSDIGIGFNLKTDKIVFYSHTYDYVKYYQSLGRNGGLRQEGTNFYIHYLIPNTIDEAVWNCLQRKESFDMALYNRFKK